MLIEVKLNDFLFKNKISKRSLSEKSGVHENVISRLCNGKTSRIDFKTLNAILISLKCELSDILVFNKEVA